MALFIPGGPAGGAPSGALGATVFSHGRFGAYMRARVIPTNPGSAGQVLARNRMSMLSNSWYNVLSAAQRAAWDTYAANVPVTNRIGQQIFLTGLNWYVGNNALRDNAAGLDRVDDAPDIFNLSSYDITDDPSASEATQVISVPFDNTDEWAQDDGALLGFSTRPQNASVHYNNKPYRLAGVELGVTATPPTSPAVFTNPFPFVEGQVLFLRVNCVQADCRIGAVQKYRIVAAA